MKIPATRFIKEDGQYLPPFYYGLTYRDCASDWTYFHIIPLNYIIRFAKWINHKWNRFRSHPSWIDKEIAKVITKRARNYDNET